MNQSDSIKELATALSKAQSEIHAAEKDSKNPFFKNSYASLTSVWEAARGPLTKNGLAVIQTTEIKSFEDDGFFVAEKEAVPMEPIKIKNAKLLLITTLVHSSGEWIRGSYLLNPTKNDPQGMGAAMSYARRYALSAIVGITQDDDDAESAIQRPPTQTSTQRPYPTQKPPIPNKM